MPSGNTVKHGWILLCMCTPLYNETLRACFTSECALTSLAVDEPLEYARLYLDGNLQMWIDSEDSLEL